MKPIFVIQMPIGTPPEVLEGVYTHIYEKELGLKEDYHVLVTIGKDAAATFKCFNSPYTPEEYSKLELLIKEIQDDYASKKN